MQTQNVEHKTQNVHPKSLLISSITDFLSRQEDILFAYIFGSFVKKDKYQDIDIAIFTSSNPNLLRLGEIQIELHIVTKQKVDLVHINNLHTQNPALAHEIVSNGLLIIDKEPITQKKFKEIALLSHFDNADLNSKMRKAFANRIRDRKIGVRNYAK